MSKRYYLHVGHGGKDPGATGPTGLKEKDVALTISKKIKTLLKNHNQTVKLSREIDMDLNSGVAATEANQWGSDYVISIHCNSAPNPAATGTETFANSPTAKGNLLAKAVHKSLVSEIKLPDRGVKYANFAIIAKTKAPACLVEVAFINNPKEEALLKDDKFLDKVAVGIARGALEHAGVKYIAGATGSVVGTPIISKTKATIEQMQEWAKRKGASSVFVDLAPTFYAVSERAGINPLVTYCQSAKETGYMRFGGVLNATYHNPCGLKTSAGGGDKDPAAHQRFKSWEEGIQAQVDHLALYAGVSGYPKANTPDPRHFPYLHGIAPTIESLGGKWAPSTAYGHEILKLMKEVEATVAPIKPVDPYAKDITINLLGRLITIKGRFKNNTNYLIVGDGDKEIPIRDIFEALGLTVEWKNNMVVIK